MNDIMQHFPFLTPRAGQLKILKALDRVWDNFDVVVIVAPTGFGKEAIGSTVINWKNVGSYLVPNNMLVQQVAQSTGFTTIKSKYQYKHPVAYNQARATLKGGKCVLNFYQYLANKAYNHNLVLDEAHTMIEHLNGMSGVKLWGHLDEFELGQFKTSEDLLLHLESNKGKNARMDKVLKILKKDPDKYIIQEDEEVYRGKIQDRLLIKPLSPRDDSYMYWPRSVKKIVLMSATFNDEDVYDLGLDRRRVFKIEADSPIPVQNRPIVYWPLGSMGMQHQAETLPKVVTWLTGALDAHPTKGIIHCTYSVATKLQKSLDNDRFIFHTVHNKEEKFNEWLKSDNKVLIASGMYEGLDLKYDLARWQVIVKVPFPNLAEPAVAAKLRQRPDSYSWAAIKLITQAYGRVCRAPDDFGVSYILDSAAGRLMKDNEDLFPQFFKDAWNANSNNKA